MLAAFAKPAGVALPVACSDVTELDAVLSCASFAANWTSAGFYCVSELEAALTLCRFASFFLEVKCACRCCDSCWMSVAVEGYVHLTFVFHGFFDMIVTVRDPYLT